MADAVFKQIEEGVAKDGAKFVKMGGAIFQINVGDHKLNIDLKNGNGKVTRSEAKADVTIALSEADFLAMADGKLDGMQAFMAGKLKIKGNMMLAQKLAGILEAAKK